jgi:hypothetical protein
MYKCPYWHWLGQFFPQGGLAEGGEVFFEGGELGPGQWIGVLEGDWAADGSLLSNGSKIKV